MFPTITHRVSGPPTSHLVVAAEAGTVLAAATGGEEAWEGAGVGGEEGAGWEGEAGFEVVAAG
jgi:hypothetical protein